VYNLPILSQLILLLHWVLVTLSDWFAPLGYSWQWGLAIIGVTVIVRLILFPLTWKQFSSAQAMQAIQPKLKELQKKHKDDRQRLQQETMKLYQEHRVNPFASCLPIILQLPVFIALYATIAGKGPLSAPEYKASVDALFNAPFLWIPKLGLPDPTYILLIVYVVTQLISTELMLVTQTDKSQKMIMRAMPIIFVIFLWKFPAGLFVYWVTTNIWTIGQQLLIRRVMKPKTAEQLASRPQKRSRFMEALTSAQGERSQTREDLVAKQRAEKAAVGGAGTKSGAKGGSARPPAKQGGQQRSKQAQSGRPASGKPGGRPAAQTAGGQSGSRQGDGQGGGSGQSGQQGGQRKPGTRKPPPGKGKRKPGAPASSGGQQGGGSQPSPAGDGPQPGQGTNSNSDAAGG
jgi:YidC/Oxa1 family membrane protein insertase